MFQRIAIINRGEAAMRLIHAVRDLNAQQPHNEPISTIALYTDQERSARFAREADEAYSIGPAAQRPYLNHELLAQVLVEVRADAVWVGWGFVAEDPAFAELVESLGITFIGPSAEAMRKLGDKIGSKLIAEEVGVPVAPWSGGGVDNLDDALAAAQRIGYPLMLKATAGGGGRGIRRIDSAEELSAAYHRTRDEAERAFGSGVVFLERLVTGARHVEVQLICDGETAWALGVRDCTIQRRNQKIIEESSCALLSAQQTDELKAAAERLALAVGYRGAGTVEFLYHPGEQLFAFLEVNTRLQVEHPITEVACDFDLVKAQIHIAAGGKLGQRPTEFGHAIEARLNAEDPDRDFAPAPGLIARLDLPAGPGIRVDTGVAEGDTIPADFDSMIAKIIAHGRTREEALGRLRRALAETTVVIEGGATNLSFVLELLKQPEVTLEGDAVPADTGWIDRVRAEGALVADDHAGVALVVAAIEAYDEATGLETDRLLDTAHGGRPQTQHKTSGVQADLKLRGQAHQVTALAIGPGQYRVIVDGQPTTAQLHRLDEVHSRITVGGQRHRVISATHGPIHLIEIDKVTHRISRDEGGVLRSPAPALVVATPVAVGDEVNAGGVVVVLESMKMETVITAPFAARVKELHVLTGSQVETMAALVRLEPLADGPAVAAMPKATVQVPAEVAAATIEQRAAELLAQLSAQLMGFDQDPQANILATYLAARDELVATGGDALTREIALLGLFADLAELSRNRPFGQVGNTELRIHSDREHFHRYLTTLDTARAGLPEQFVVRLTRALGHYGVTSLERTAALEEAVFRIFLAQKRAAADAPIVMALLERWIVEPAPAGELNQAVRAHLERVLRATQLRFPAIADLARSVRFSWFDQPLVDAERATILAGVAAEVDALAADVAAPDYSARIQRLAAIPEWTANFLASRLGRDGVPRVEPMLEVLLRKYYTDFGLDQVRSFEVDGRAVLCARYRLDEQPHTVVATLGTAAELNPDGPLARVFAEQCAARPAGDVVVGELYVLWDGPIEPEALGAEVLARLAGWSFDAGVQRLAVAVCAADGTVEYRSYLLDGGQLRHDELVRSMHPMAARRLDLWRLRDFEVTRLDAPEDVLLLECVAKTNPQDRRLVAMSQVRQIATVRDETGRVIGIPHAERAVANCMEAIRRTRSARGAAGSKLDQNHVWVYVWPMIDLELADILPLQDKITPLTDGTGIEEVVCHGRFLRDGAAVPLSARFHEQPGGGVGCEITEPPSEPLKPLDDYASKVLRARRRGLVYPYELSSTLAGPGGIIVELDLDEQGRLVEVDRAPGGNQAGIIVARVTTPTALHPEGMTRIVLCGDPTKGLGAVAEPECARIIAALDLAEELAVPVEWFTLSSGARISMSSGVENMDWVGAALRRIVEFTQAGGEINVVVAGINVGAQPYWNAEATMLMHTKGILIMTPDSAMVLTGKQSLDFSGGVSAEDNFGIGGYDRVMGPNGQAQYWAPNLGAAMGILIGHYDATYVAAGEAGPRRADTSDPVARDVTGYPHELPGSEFTTVGQIFSAEHNPDRKKPFDIRTVIAAICDQDHDRVERWAGMAEAETAVVIDARIGGHSVSVLGIESAPVPRAGFPPTDGPDTFTAGTLFPRSSKKAARAINAASGNRPLVVLANLSGFDGSPESMRNLQLEYGAEIGRAIVNFIGPIVFVVISRYHGGAFVVFSKQLNPNMTVLAVEGSFASVIGGAPAAAVVFAGDVAKRTATDDRVRQLEDQIAVAGPEERAELQVQLGELRAVVRAEMISQLAAEFDAIHSIHRAVEVGSVDRVIQASELRPAIVAAIEAYTPRD